MFFSKKRPTTYSFRVTFVTPPSTPLLPPSGGGDITSPDHLGMFACAIAIAPACAIATVHACAIAIVHACTIAIVHACAIAIVHACTIAMSNEQ